MTNANSTENRNRTDKIHSHPIWLRRPTERLLSRELSFSSHDTTGAVSQAEQSLLEVFPIYEHRLLFITWLKLLRGLQDRSGVLVRYALRVPLMKEPGKLATELGKLLNHPERDTLIMRIRRAAPQYHEVKLLHAGPSSYSGSTYIEPLAHAN